MLSKMSSDMLGISHYYCFK